MGKQSNLIQVDLGMSLTRLWDQLCQRSASLTKLTLTLQLLQRKLLIQHGET
jgi:hypothetical protein